MSSTQESALGTAVMQLNPNMLDEGLKMNTWD